VKCTGGATAEDDAPATESRIFVRLVAGRQVRTGISADGLATLVARL